MMTTVEQLIGDLLLRHNCVIIPSFGGFIAKPVSAQIDFKKGTMTPPSKSLLFNRQLINNDGLVINELAQVNNISFDAASSIIETHVQEWNTVLKEGGRLEIDRVGNLYFDEECNICFEQDRFFNLLLDSFGLSTVHFLSEEDVQIVEQRISVEQRATESVTAPQAPIFELESETKEDAPTIVVETPSLRKKPSANEPTPIVKEMPVGKKKRKAWRYVAAACILPIAFYSVWIPTKTDFLESGMLSLQDFNPFHTPVEATYEKEDISTDQLDASVSFESLTDELEQLDDSKAHYSYQFSDDTYILVALSESDDVPSDTAPSTEQTTHSATNAAAMNYIVGCFANPENAENLVALLQANGLDARILDINKGLHRVTAGSAFSIEEYARIKSTSDALGYSGWKLK